MSSSFGNRWRAFGPGVLFAGIAVGASHLVQSTRAGADFALALVVVIVATNIAKYPAFRFGAEYASVTGSTLLDGYLRQGRWAVAMYVVVALGTMFAAVPAVTLVTAGLAQTVFGLELPTLWICAAILASSALLLAAGGFRLLDRLVKLVMSLLVLSTLVATILVLPRIDFSFPDAFVFPEMTPANVFFIAALIGWMPTSVDISVWHSLWSVAKSNVSDHRATPAEARWDFNIGYFGTAALALCFVALGAGTMYGRDVSYAPSAAGFAEQLIAMYVDSLGPWSGPLIGAAAFCVMLSTVVTGIDGYPRVAVELFRLARSGASKPLSRALERRCYALALVVLALGSFGVLYFFLTALRVFVDVAATVAFLVGPIIAWLNHRAMLGADVPVALRPGPTMQALSIVGIVLLSAIALYYLIFRVTQ